MTYRRLLLYLLLGGAMLLAGVWWYSFRTLNAFMVAVPNHKVISGGGVGAVHCGTVSFIWIPGGAGSHWIDFHNEAVSGLPPGDRYGVMGRFRVGHMDEEGIPSSHLAVQLPLWLVYLLLAGAGVVLMRWGERRSASVEKALALRNAAKDAALENETANTSPMP
ncbi:MAG: hypothetical protein EOP88_12600 [Verrucomicrobiaceae bacterium]|nr:MAG: hypothetical protein EOP88_12600 [Verrucomicrobiaceae bacterium]